jgi:hypothetical protein
MKAIIENEKGWTLDRVLLLSELKTGSVVEHTSAKA